MRFYIKNKTVTFILAMLLCGLSSCDSYLDVDKYFYDMTSLDSIFARKELLNQYINGTSAWLPAEDRLWTNSPNPFSYTSDEAFSSWNDDRHAAIKYPLGEIDRFTGRFNNWPGFYKGIRKANLIIDRIGECKDLSEMDRRDYTGQAYFLRAYFYYCLLRQYGPIPILPDKAFETNEAIENLSYSRNKYDECVEYICKGMEEAAGMLVPERDSEAVYRTATRGAALAIIARLRLEAASPWFNGNAYYYDFLNAEGQHYFPQTKDPNKWALAAAAARRVIDTGKYSIYTIPKDRETPELPTSVSADNFPDGAGNIDPFKSYSDLFTGEEIAMNISELIWTRYCTVDLVWIAFPSIMGGGNGLNVSQNLVDAYRMVDGRDINESSTEYPYPSTDEAHVAIGGSGKTFSGYQLRSQVPKMYDNREMRFYASIGFNHAFWEASSYTGTDVNKKNLEVTYYLDGTGAAWSDYPRDKTFSGYTSRKYLHSSDSPSGQYRAKSFPLIRYAEILLNYVEAMNEMEGTYTDEENGITVSRDTEEMKRYFNMIRYRAGLPGVTDAEVSDRDVMRELIKRERQVEFALEGHRFYDLRRWGDLIKATTNGFFGMNVEAKKNDRPAYHRRTPMTYEYSIFSVTNKHMLYPINQSIIDKNPKLDQNPGW